MALELVPYLLYEPEDNGILWIKFNNPAKMNALQPDSAANCAKLVEYMRAGDADPNIRVIVVTGVGRGFCSGADTRLSGARREQEQPRGPDASRQGFLYYTQVPYYNISQICKPTIAMVNGAAVGMGMDIALHCDIRYGCENSRFFTYQNLGQLIENGGMYWLPHIAGIGNALEVLFTGGFLEAQRAYDCGVLNKLVPSDKLEEETRALCTKIINSPPLVQWVGKRIMRRALGSNLEAILELCAHGSDIMSRSEDSKEARAAWLARRTPHFKGF